MDHIFSATVGYAGCRTQTLKVLRPKASPDSDSYYLCSVGELTAALRASVFSSVKWEQWQYQVSGDALVIGHDNKCKIFGIH